MAVTKDDILKLAQLSGLGVTAEEVELYTKEIEEILTYIDQLDEVDTAGLEPTYQVTGLSNVMRDDEVIDYHVTPEELLAGSAETEAHMIKVPKVLG